MNKKGFTLVELLAVIAILAILVVMAMPNVLDMFNTSKKNSFKNEVSAILREANADFIQNAISGTGAGTYTEDGSLKISMNTSARYAIIIDENGNITSAKITNGKYCYSKTGENISHTDTIAAAEITDYSASGPCSGI